VKSVTNVSKFSDVYKNPFYILYIDPTGTLTLLKMRNFSLFHDYQGQIISNIILLQCINFIIFFPLILL